MLKRLTPTKLFYMAVFVLMLGSLVFTIAQAIVSEPFINPHGSYGQGAGSNTAVCAKCHAAHTSGSMKLMRLATQRQTCYACHDSNLASLNIRGQFGEVSIGTSVFNAAYGSYHPVPTGRQLCSDCHDPHLATDTAGGTASLLAVGPQSIKTGNAVCGYCHGTGSTAPGGDILANYVYTPHDTGLAGPSSNTGIKCSRCHQPHGSQYDSLLRTTIQDVYNNVYNVTGNNNTVCFACHFTASNTFPGQITYMQVYHGVYAKYSSTIAASVYQGTSYSWTMCLNCHDVHGKYGNADYRRAGDNTLCTKCHDAAGKTRPAGYSYQGITAYNSTPHASQTGNSAKYAGDCDYCHAPHGAKDGSGTLIAKQLNKIPASVCFGAAGTGCHSDSNGSVRNINISQRFTLNADARAHHSITQTEQTAQGTKIKCADCHNPHKNNSSNKIIDPANKSNIYTPTNQISNYIDGSGNFYLQVKAMHDGSPPVLSSINAVALPASTTITWTTNEDSTSWVVFDTVYHNNVSEYIYSGGNTTLTTAHSVTVNGTSGITYYYRVISVDALGNQAVSSNLLATFRQQEAPPVPTMQSVADSNPGGVSDAFTLTANWTAVTQGGDPIKYYAEVISTANSGYINPTTYGFSLSNQGSVTYYVRVKAKNMTSGAESEWSNTLPLTHVGTTPSSVSCPFIYVWDGQKYNYVTDAMNKTMGLGPKTRDYPLEGPLYTVLEPAKPKDGKFPIRIREVLDEATFLDTSKFYLAEHPAGYQVASSTAENYLYFHKRNPEKWYTYKDPVLPKSAVDSDGKDVLETISKADGKAIPGVRRGEYDVTLDFGRVKNPQYTKLVFEGWNDGGVGKKTKSEHNGYVAVINEKGQWEQVKEFGFFSGDLKTIVVELGDVFKTDDHRVKVNIGTMPKHHSAFDRIRLDDSVPVPIRLIEMPLEEAVLSHRGDATHTDTSMTSRVYALDDTLPDNPKRYFYGSFTKYGDVTPLLKKTDDMFVIMRHGDQIDLTFGADYSPKDGMEYTPVMMNDLYYRIAKKMPRNVDLLPFHAMSDYPYPENEHYPDDEEHQDYLKDWNTRYYDPSGKTPSPGLGETIKRFFQRVIHSFAAGFTRLWELAFGPPLVQEVAISVPSKGASMEPRQRIKGPDKEGQYHYSLNTDYVILTTDSLLGGKTYTAVYASAWESGTPMTPTIPGTTATAQQLSNANVHNDGSNWNTNISTAEGSYNYQMFKFSLTEQSSGIDSLYVAWAGYGEPTAGHPVVVSVWNFGLNDWEQIYSNVLAVPGTVSWVKYRDITGFCNKCHNNNPPAGVVMGSTRNVAVPYLNPTTAYAPFPASLTADLHGSGSGVQPFAASAWGTNAGHYVSPASTFRLPYGRSMAALSCEACHDPHGSASLFHIRQSINGQAVTTLTNINDNNQFTSVCAACHIGTVDNYHSRCLNCHRADGSGSEPAGHGGAPWDDNFDRTCISCHYHGAVYPRHSSCDHCSLDNAVKAF